MRQDVEFQADGPRLRGWLYTPDAARPPFATIVMAHGFSAVKEMYLDRFGEAFAEAGLAALPGVTSAERRGEAVVLRCSDSDAAIRALLAAHPSARDIEITGAGLEEAFLELTAG